MRYGDMVFCSEACAEVWKGENKPDKGMAEIIILKQRNGPIGTVKLTLLGEYTRFENYAQGASF